MSMAITASAQDHGAEFPFFEVPSYEVLGHGIRNQALFETVAFAPLVKHQDREQYLQFANQTRGWLDESKKIYDKLKAGANRSSEPPTPPYPQTFMCVSHEEEKEDYSKVVLTPCLNDEDLYLPLLQISPPPFPNQTYHNIDYFTNPTYKSLAAAADQVANVVFSQIDADPSAFDFVFGSEIHSLVHTHPHTLTALPVFNDIGLRDVVGYIFGVVAWDKYMTGKSQSLSAFY